MVAFTMIISTNAVFKPHALILCQNSHEKLLVKHQNYSANLKQTLQKQ